MSHNRDSNLISRIMIAFVIILTAIGLYSIILNLWQGAVISIFERLFATILILVIVGVLGMVIFQRIQMRKTENFRREKW